MNQRRRAFTLIEMLIATLLAAILMGGVLSMSAALARDQRRLAARAQDSTGGIVELLRFDLANARSVTQSPDGQTLVLVGHGGLDRRSMSPTNRLTRVVYRVDSPSGNLSREQTYLDDPARPARWTELAATGIARIDIIPASGDSDFVREPALNATLFAPNRKMGDVKSVAMLPESRSPPTRVRIRIASTSSPLDQEIWVR
jgi:prepilin-type N-terminal cleavage/methylation domain-containing protein